LWLSLFHKLMLYQLFWKSPVFLMGAMGWPNIYSQTLEKATLRQNPTTVHCVRRRGARGAHHAADEV
jgi:hypothetical protein